MEGFLAFSGVALLSIGVIAIILFFILLLDLAFNKNLTRRPKTISLIKTTLLVSAMCFAIGTGACALQFHFYPLNIGH